MASRSLRRVENQLSEDLIPVDYHGLETKGELRAHTEQFRITKDEILQGKWRRRNSTNDCRTQATIKAAGPDARFDDIAIEESGLRDGLYATQFMPSFPNVQDFTRRSARWEDSEQVSNSEAEEVEQSSLLSPPSNSSNFAANARTNAKASKQSTRSQSRSTSTTTAQDTRHEMARGSTSTAPTTDSIFYKCYALNCKYEHARRSNFSIHWKRDAKHPGTFELKNVLQCTRDQAGKITTVPYGNINMHRQRMSSGTGHEGSTKQTSVSTSNSDVEAAVPESRKRKAPAADSQDLTQTASTAFSTGDSETTCQDSDPTNKDLIVQASATSSARIYSSLECQMFKRLTDVPVTFPPNMSPLITHGTPDTGSQDLKDCRFFCPECEKCFTQTHNVASHFSRHHGRQYSKNERARTVFCRVTVSDAKPVDDTVLPRLNQIRWQRAQTAQSQEAANISASNASILTQTDTPAHLTSNIETDPAKPLVKTSQVNQLELANFPIAGQSATESSQSQSPRKSSQRIQRMQAVRESILTRASASPIVTANHATGLSEDSYTTGKTIEVDSTTTANADNQHGALQLAGILGSFKLANPAAGSIAAASRQPEWERTNQSAQGPRGQKRKRSLDSDGSAKDEEITCTDDETDNELIGDGIKTAQKENDGDETAPKPTKRQRTLTEYLGLEMYSSD